MRIMRRPCFHPRIRRRLSWLVVLLLVWQQLAVAAFACAMPQGAAASAPVATAGADRMAMGDSCASMQEGQSQPPLCKAHCSPDHATQPEARTGTVPPNLLAALPADWPVLPANATARAWRPERLYRLRAPPPPASLLFCSLLI
jgi:hypothetical protein